MSRRRRQVFLDEYLALVDELGERIELGTEVIARTIRRMRGKPDGYATLDSDGRVPFSQMPDGIATHVLTGNGLGVNPSYQPGGSGGGGASAFSSATVNLTGPSVAGSVDLGGLAGLTIGKPVLVWQSATDDVEFDQLAFSGVVLAADTIRIHWWATERIATGVRAINYLVGA